MKLSRTLIATGLLGLMLSGVCVASQGYPWWLIPTPSPSSGTGGVLQVQTSFGLSTNVSRLVLTGSAVTAMTSSGSTSTVTFTAGSGGSTNTTTSLWVFAGGGDLIPNTNATVTVDMWWKLGADGDLIPRGL